MGKSYQPPIYVQQSLDEMRPHLIDARTYIRQIARLPWMDNEVWENLVELEAALTADIEALKRFTPNTESRTK